MRERRDTETLGALAADELAAVESYRRALARLEDDPEVETLRRIEDEHERALTLLQEELAERGEEPALGGSAWRGWVRSLEGAAALFGAEAAWRSLREGEEKARRGYERALDDEALDRRVKSLIRAELLPQALGHLAAIDHRLSQGRLPS